MRKDPYATLAEGADTMAQTERKVCHKCGLEYASMQADAVSGDSFGHYERIADKTTCPECGGTVLWVDEKGVPLDREWYAKHRLKMGIRRTIPPLIVLVLLVLIRSCNR